MQQYRAIARYERQNHVPVYYLLYQPWQIPHTVTYPLMADQASADSCEVGCRVIPAEDLRSAMNGKAEGLSPACDELRRTLDDPFTTDEHRGGWRLEHFVVGLLLDCQAGYIADRPSDAGLNYIFNRRSGPISAALALTTNAP